MADDRAQTNPGHGHLGAGRDEPAVFLFALPAGAVGDLVDRRRLSIVLQVASAVLAMALALSTLMGFTTPEIILVASFLFGTILAFSMPVLQAIVPDLVPRSELAPAVSLNASGLMLPGSLVLPSVAG